MSPVSFSRPAILVISVKRLGLLRDLVPNAIGDRGAGWTRVPPRDRTTSGREWNQGRRALGSAHRDGPSRPMRRELDSAFATMVRAGAGGLLVGGGPFLPSGRTSKSSRLPPATRCPPAMYVTENYAEAGGLMSYGPNQPDAYRQAGIYVARILRGHQAGRLAGRAGDQVRVGDQPQDRQDARPGHSQRPCNCLADEVIE